MTAGDQPPVVILAFANDPDEYLKNIRRERANLFASLRDLNDRRLIDVYKEEETSIDHFFELFTRYADRVAVLHYGGHASGTSLQLESAAGTAETAHAAGLAKLLGMQKNLQLVFLNGCATQGQVEQLLACGVRAVIATAVPINDLMATEFAEQFYAALARNASIAAAFGTASALIATRYADAGPRVETFRGGFVAARSQPAGPAPVWGLYVNAGAEAVLDWKLPQVPAAAAIIRGAPPAVPGTLAVSQGLIDTTLQALSAMDEDVRRAADPDGRNYDPRALPDLIVDVFPAPIGEQLRKLFAGQAADMAQLRQMVITYEVIGKLFAFIMLSQLWNTRFERPDIAIGDEQWAVLNSFPAIDAQTRPLYDYFKLTTTIVDILAANGVTSFVPEFAGLSAELNDAPTTLARNFMDEMRAELWQGNMRPEEIESFCQQAERHLATLLADLAFVVKYSFSTIKSIDVLKVRHRDAEFKLRTARLDKVNATFKKDQLKSFATVVDNESVILHIYWNDISKYLNLTPFVIDQNIGSLADGSRLYLYDYRDLDGNARYVSVDDVDEELTVNQGSHPEIEQQIRAFFDMVYCQPPSVQLAPAQAVPAPQPQAAP